MSQVMGLPDPAFWRGRRVLLTGHTGFKGAWLSFWLSELGAQVHGLSVDVPTQPSLYEQAGLAERLASDVRMDIRDQARLGDHVAALDPEVVLHLAAQPLVRASYARPLETFETNVMGTAYLLEAARRAPSLRSLLVVTTDKCYDNHEWVHPYRESDPLGGHDPYSASKACAELVAASWRDSFGAALPFRIATARAGNVIGGGDWAQDRLVPDCIRAFQQSRTVVLRRPDAVRPWQHVLEPLCGYLLLAQRLAGAEGGSFARAYNFGPAYAGSATVLQVAQSVAALWQQGAAVRVERDPDAPAEAGLLRLDSTLAMSQLGWAPRFTLAQALEATVDLYRQSGDVPSTGAAMGQQLRAYAELA
jgi:CDP-glucose 4,6-dehydratase